MEVQETAATKGENEPAHKTAIIYCRATDINTAKRQQAEAETKVKELNATVKAIFIDIMPIPKQTIWRRFARFFRKNRPKSAGKRAEWRKASTYLKENKIDYVITRRPNRISRNPVEFGKIASDIRGLDTRFAYFAVK